MAKDFQPYLPGMEQFMEQLERDSSTSTPETNTKETTTEENSEPPNP